MEHNKNGCDGVQNNEQHVPAQDVMDEPGQMNAEDDHVETHEDADSGVYGSEVESHSLSSLDSTHSCREDDMRSHAATSGRDGCGGNDAVPNEG